MLLRDIWSRSLRALESSFSSSSRDLPLQDHGNPFPVIPAQAGIQLFRGQARRWIVVESQIIAVVSSAASGLATPRDEAARQSRARAP